MNTKQFISRIGIFAALVVLVVGLPSLSAGAASVGTAFTYQGQLTKGGSAYTGSCDFQFSLYDALSGGTQVGSTDTQTGVTVTNGLFTVQLDFGASAFTGSARWLEIKVQCVGDSGYTTLTPRQPLTPAPYALFASAATNFSGALGGDVSGTQSVTSVTRLRGFTLASTAPTSGQVLQYNGTQWAPASALAAFWSLTGNSGTVAGTNFLGTLDNVALEFRVNNSRALRLEPNTTSPNILGGYSGNWLTSGVVGAVIGGGGYASNLNIVTDNYGVVGGGANNRAGDNNGTTSDNPYATIGGGLNNYATRNSATIGGGSGNSAGGAYSTIGGGYLNNTGNSDATVAGGYGNNASGAGTFIGGGGYDGTTFSGNTAAAKAATIGGGLGNQVPSGADYASIGGGKSNTANGVNSTISGGSSNTASGNSATISGGASNTASGLEATIGGGDGNNASNAAATIGGGENNTASGLESTVSGGHGNTATGTGAFIGGGGYDGTTISGNIAAAQASTIGGGLENKIDSSAIHATIGGGYINTASGSTATISGGQTNTASGGTSTIGGGFANTASGAFSTVGAGADNIASGADSSIGGGGSNTASGQYSTVAGGQYAAATHYGETAHASGKFTTSGDAQTSEYVLRNTTTNASYTELFLDGGSQRITLASNRTLSFDILIAAHSDNDKSAGYKILGLITNVGGTTAFVGAPMVDILGEDVTAWDATVEVDNTNGALVIKVKGAASATTRWVASVRTVEVGW